MSADISTAIIDWIEINWLFFLVIVFAIVFIFMLLKGKAKFPSISGKAGR